MSKYYINLDLNDKEPMYTDIILKHTKESNAFKLKIPCNISMFDGFINLDFYTMEEDNFCLLEDRDDLKLYASKKIKGFDFTLDEFETSSLGTIFVNVTYTDYCNEIKLGSFIFRVKGDDCYC